MKAENVGLKDSKVFDAVIGFIFNYCTTKVTVSDFFFLDTNEYNDQNHCKCSIYYY